MSNPERDYFAMESDAEHRAEIAKADHEHPSDPYGWEANRVQTRWERQQFERGTTDALYLWVGSILVAFGALSILWPLLVWLLLAAVALMATVGVACVVVGGRRADLSYIARLERECEIGDAS